MFLNAYPEVDSEGGDGVAVEEAFGVAGDEARLAHAGVAHQDELEPVV